MVHRLGSRAEDRYRSPWKVQTYRICSPARTVVSMSMADREAPSGDPGHPDIGPFNPVGV